ncbi:MAG: molybdopterin-dependent oxidoreductase [Acidimicrobiales bacterium]|nr:molybdopterin-dependent oxidoreductase [Acidimicrobiales bacterium]
MSELSRRLTESADERLARLAAEAAEGPTISTAEYSKRSRRSFLTGAVAAAAGIAGFRAIQNRPLDGRTPDVLRKGYEWNEFVWETLGSQSKLAPTYALADATSIRVNGRLGLPDNYDLSTYELTVKGINDEVLETFDLEGMRTLINSFPQVDVVMEHKCIEGWSAKPRWGGAVFADFASRYADDVPSTYGYVAMETSDARYYVGVDRATMLNRQSLLATKLGAEDLSLAHGAPLRLATPHKYGIKSIKQIATIRFTNERPDDYWAERGYTYWAGF